MTEMTRLKTAWQYTVGIKRSIWAFLATAALGLLSMGALGGGLYYLVFFGFPASYPDFDKAHGDWVWPSMIAVGMAWSVGFLIAGALNLALAKSGKPAVLRKLIYIVILWIWAYLLWFLALSGR